MVAVKVSCRQSRSEDAIAAIDGGRKSSSRYRRLERQAGDYIGVELGKLLNARGFRDALPASFGSSAVDAQVWEKRAMTSGESADS